jgi:hypothetical protein
MHIVPIWVKFPNLPLKCWSLKCLSKIASVLGKPVQSDMLTSSMSRLSFIPGSWWKSTCYLTCLTLLKLLCPMAACSINKLYMKPSHASASIAEPLVTLLQHAPNPCLLLFQATSRLLTLLLLPRTRILFSTGWDPK